MTASGSRDDAVRTWVPGVSGQAAVLLAAAVAGAATNGQPPLVDLAWYAVPVALVAAAVALARRGPVRDLDPAGRRIVERFALAGAVGLALLSAWQVFLLEFAGGAVPDPVFTFVGAAGLGLVAGTAFGWLYADQARAARRAERDRARLEEFASVLSHDLRSPLGVARGRLELARETGDETHLAEIDAALGRMDDLVEQVLALARGGPEVLSPAAVTVDDLVRRCWDLVETGDAELVVEGDPTVVADEDRLRQALENLLENAVVHGDASVVRVGPLEGGGLYVADDGAGVPPGERDRVFERGYSTDDGPGLGLAIVAAVAREHGWSVRVTDSDEGGARFELSTGDGDAEPPAAPAGAPDAPSG